jgi:hypothetical protein
VAAVVADDGRAVGQHGAVDLAELAEDVPLADARRAEGPGLPLDLRIAAQGDARPHHALLAQLERPLQAGVRPDSAAVADGDAGAEDGVRPDLDAGADARAGIDDGRLVHAHDGGIVRARPG